MNTLIRSMFFNCLIIISVEASTGLCSPDENGSSNYHPNIGRYFTYGPCASEKFIVDLDEMEDKIERVTPYYNDGSYDRSQCFHPGAHIEFSRQSAKYWVDVIAPVSGYIQYPGNSDDAIIDANGDQEMIQINNGQEKTYCDKVEVKDSNGNVVGRLPKKNILISRFARYKHRNGESYLVDFLLSLETQTLYEGDQTNSDDPHGPRDGPATCEDIELRFIPDEKVERGQVIARMVIHPEFDPNDHLNSYDGTDRSPHIHYNLKLDTTFGEGTAPDLAYRRRGDDDPNNPSSTISSVNYFCPDVFTHDVKTVLSNHMVDYMGQSPGQPFSGLPAPSCPQGMKIDLSSTADPASRQLGVARTICNPARMNNLVTDGVGIPMPE